MWHLWHIVLWMCCYTATKYYLLFPVDVPGSADPLFVLKTEADPDSKVLLLLISVVKPTRCTSVSHLFILEWHSTCFGRSFRPSPGVQVCTCSNRHMSNRYCCLLASGYSLASRQHCPSIVRSSRLYIQQANRYCCLLANKHSAVLFDICLLLYVQSWTPDDGMERPSETCRVSLQINIFDTLVHLVCFTVEIILWCTAVWTSNLLLLLPIHFVFLVHHAMNKDCVICSWKGSSCLAGTTVASQTGLSSMGLAG